MTGSPSAAGPPTVGHQLAVLLDQRRLIARLGLVAALAVVGWSSVTPRSFTSESAFMPQTRRPPSPIGGLAAQLGLTVALGDPGLSPAFYADLLRSRSVLDSLGGTRFSETGEVAAEGPTLLDRLGIEAESPAVRRSRGVEALARAVRVTVNQRTGTVRLAVSLPTAELARGANLRLLDLLNRFNLETRQSQATAERRFTEQRLAEVRESLTAAEERLKVFLERNRTYRNSPELTFRQERLAREVDVQQQLHASLAQAFEQAKIEEVRDLPVITVVEQPDLPPLPDPRRRVRKALLALVGGGIAGVFLAFARAPFRPQGDAPTAASLATLLAETRRDLARPWKLLLSRRPGARG